MKGSEEERQRGPPGHSNLNAAVRNSNGSGGFAQYSRAEHMSGRYKG